MSLLDQFRHETIDKSQHQRSDMRPVHIGIRHNNDLIIPQLCDIEILMDACTESSNHGFDLFISVDPVKPCLLHIQNFTAKRQNCLCGTASCGLGRAPCGISLYDINLTVFRIFIGTIRQFTGQSTSL